jgi:hypothetical protein
MLVRHVDSPEPIFSRHYEGSLRSNASASWASAAAREAMIRLNFGVGFFFRGGNSEIT